MERGGHGEVVPRALRGREIGACLGEELLARRGRVAPHALSAFDGRELVRGEIGVELAPRPLRGGHVGVVNLALERRLLGGVQRRELAVWKRGTPRGYRRGGRS